jgi:hypothetical protein
MLCKTAHLLCNFVATNDILLTALLIILNFGSVGGCQPFMSIHFITQKVHYMEGIVWDLQNYVCVLVLVLYL